jgi:hypothetical protein
MFKNPDDPFPADVYRRLARRLRDELPPRPNESAEDRTRRETSLIAVIASLAPANDAEADAVLGYVLASEAAHEWLHRVQIAGTSLEQAYEYRNKAIAETRKAEKALKLLLRLQKARRLLEADNRTGNRASNQRPAPAASADKAKPTAQPKPTGRSSAEIASLWATLPQDNRTVH